jgi:prolyl oligopeptidase
VSVKTGESSVWAKVQLPIDPSRFVTEQVWYPSKDGTKVSMFLVHRKDVRPDGQIPTLLYGYGGFDVSLTPDFRASIYPWLEAGGVYALANLRGGGEYGKAWHEAGQLHQKQNVFDDFLAAARWLTGEGGWTNPGKLAIQGGSNGGLLVGATMVQAPSLFRAVICQVPLLDMIRYPLFGAGKTWMPEYGDPSKEEDFRVLLAYSPYQQVREGVRYPALLLMSSDHDDRVDPMHARKFAARVQADSASGLPAWLRVERHAGHGGADRIDQTVDALTDQYAFLFQQLEVPAP